MDIVTSDDHQTDALITARALVLHDLEATSTATPASVSALEQAASALPETLRPAFLPLVLSRAYLRKMESARHSPLKGVAQLSALRRHWLLLRHAARGWPPL